MVVWWPPQPWLPAAAEPDWHPITSTSNETWQLLTAAAAA